jgi:hypothetical protein
MEGSFAKNVFYFCVTGLSGAATYFISMGIMGELAPLKRLLKRG